MRATPLQPYAPDSSPATSADGDFERHVKEFLYLIGEDPTRDGLLETPGRVRQAWREWTSGYRMDPRDVLKSFVDDAPGPGARQLLTLRDIPVYSICEHHLAPFFGTARVCYIPRGRIVGLSKLARVVEGFSRRLQVQERLTEQVAEAIDAALEPVGVGVFLCCRHLCMESRGVRARGAITETAAYRGALRSDAGLRAEFLLRSSGKNDE